MRRKKYKQEIDQQLLDAIFYHEAEWKKAQRIVDMSIDPLKYSQHKMILARAQYMFLLREAKRRKISYL